MDHLQKLIDNYPMLNNIRPSIESAYIILRDSFLNNGKLLIAGNGGSAADAEHIVGELMKNFIKKRTLPNSFIDNIKMQSDEISSYLVSHLQPGLPAIALSVHTSLNTACINDIDGNITFSQQVYTYGNEGDVFLGISTSGNSKNILYAAATAKAKKIKIIGLTGGNGGLLKEFTDAIIIVPENETYRIQELHLPVYHCICLMLEDYFF